MKNTNFLFTTILTSIFIASCGGGGGGGGMNDGDDILDGLDGSDPFGGGLGNIGSGNQNLNQL